jgi:hypothetical protein
MEVKKQTTTELLRYVEAVENNKKEEFKIETEDSEDEQLCMEFTYRCAKKDPFQGFWGNLAYLITSKDNDVKMKQLIE